MNLSLYSVNAFLILDTEGSRVLAKYYRPKSHPLGESKEFLTLKEQKAFEKGLWQKTKKAGGARPFPISGLPSAPSPAFEKSTAVNAMLISLQVILFCTMGTWQYTSTRWT
jgi:hypothetical protein